MLFKSRYKVITHSKTAKFIYAKKVKIAKRVFKLTSFGYRIGKSVHKALHYVKTR